MEEMYNEEELRSLFGKYLHKNCSEEEIRRLMSYSEEDAFLPIWQELMESIDVTATTEEIYSLHKPTIDRTYANIIRQHQPRRIIYYRWAAAAGLLLLITAGFYLKEKRQPEPMLILSTEPAKYDVTAGTDKATLQLADGSVIPLDSTGRQVLQQGGTSVQQQGGQLIYNTKQSTAIISYNTLKTPLGGQFRLTLPDGTNVWLNAISSIHYPTAFTGKERTVEITGEAYFEVAKNASMPFRVKVGSQAEIEVLGTGFNVNAYADEQAITTTLVAGAIRVHARGQDLQPAPGQQVELTDAGLRILKGGNITQAIAWKDGFFSFTRADLPTVMRQLARWYDLDISYQGTAPQALFSGDIDRSLTLDQVLKGLARNRIHYKIEEGRKLIILP